MVAECTKACDTQKSPDKTADAKPCAANTKPCAANTDANKKSPKDKDNNGTEQAPEVTTSTADDASLQAKTSEDVALILSAEEESELCPTTNEEVKDKPKPVTEEKEEASKTKKKPKKTASKSVWVSNISKGTKAADLKKLFSENFKVESAKIVTNGKCFFGYITLETSEMVQKAVMDLNGFNLAGKTISVSIMRPDLRNARANIEEQKKQVKEKLRKSLISASQEGKDPKPKEDKEADAGLEKAKDSSDQATEKAAEKKTEKTTEKTAEKTAEKTTEKTAEKQQDSQVSESTKTEIKEQKQSPKPDKSEKLIKTLKKDLDSANDELRITKRRLREANKRLDFERTRKTELLREVSKLEAALKAEKRKISQEREQIEKQKKINDLRYEEDRSIINKELEECKRLREYLQTRADELGARSRHRSRSPLNRSPVRRSAQASRSMPERGSGSMNKNPRSSRALHMSPPKQRGYENPQTRQRSPPPPPKLTKRSSPVRGHDRSPPSYKSSKKARMEYPLSSYSSGPTGGSKDHAIHYPQPSTMSVPSRVGMWNTSYKMPYRYSPTRTPSAYPMVSSTVMQMAPSGSSRSMEYSEYSKRVAGGLRKY